MEKLCAPPAVKFQKNIFFQMVKFMSVNEKKNVGRPRLWFSEGELAIAYKILTTPIIKPPVCVCGITDYAFGIYSGSGIVAKCRNCDYRRRFNPYEQAWGPRV
jgi:hypothetical protein